MGVVMTRRAILAAVGRLIWPSVFPISMPTTPTISEAENKPIKTATSAFTVSLRRPFQAGKGD
jgi:hypothetical protein